METTEAICFRIRQLCRENQMTVNALSARCGITQSTLNNILSGRNVSTTISTVQKICDGLGMSLADFFAYELFGQVRSNGPETG